MKKLLTACLLLVLLTSCANIAPATPPENTPPTTAVTTKPTKVLPTATPQVTPQVTPTSTPPVVVTNPTPAPTPTAPEVFDTVYDAAYKYNTIIGYYVEYAKTNLQYDDCIELCNNIANELGNLTEEEYERLQYSCFGYRNGNLLYAIHDVNSDGIYELITFYEMEDIVNDDGSIYYEICAVYSLDGDTPFLLDAYINYRTCTIDENGVFYETVGLYDDYDRIATYEIDPVTKRLVMTAAVGYDSYDGEKGEWLDEKQYYAISAGEKLSIGEGAARTGFRYYEELMYAVPSPSTFAELVQYVYVK